MKFLLKVKFLMKSVGKVVKTTSEMVVIAVDIFNLCQWRCFGAFIVDLEQNLSLL